MDVPKELKEKVIEAIKAGKYFITISCKIGDPPNDLKHFWVTHDYPKDDLINSLNHLKDDVTNKEIREKKSETKETVEWL